MKVCAIQPRYSMNACDTSLDLIVLANDYLCVRGATEDLPRKEAL